jgi:hypothetical protein
MLWTEVRSWAKSHGYEVLKDKGDEEKDEKVQYYWSKIDDPQASGVSPSVSKLARDIYNHITDNSFVEYQKQYQENKQQAQFSTSNYK